VSVEHVFASIPVADYAAARDWYERFFGREPGLVPNDVEACWQVTDTGWVYVIEDPERAGSGLVTLLVDDLSAWSDETDESIPGMRRAEISDPDGNRIQVAQQVS
jgi:catechol 2,3-dioxygenase-like lactoylglutathione lyase family enzyme